jgi:hypothetical protein
VQAQAQVLECIASTATIGSAKKSTTRIRVIQLFRRINIHRGVILHKGKKRMHSHIVKRGSSNFLEEVTEYKAFHYIYGLFV